MRIFFSYGFLTFDAQLFRVEFDPLVFVVSDNFDLDGNPRSIIFAFARLHILGKSGLDGLLGQRIHILEQILFAGTIRVSGIDGQNVIFFGFHFQTTHGGRVALMIHKLGPVVLERLFSGHLSLTSNNLENKYLKTSLVQPVYRNSTPCLL